MRLKFHIPHGSKQNSTGEVAAANDEEGGEGDVDAVANVVPGEAGGHLAINICSITLHC